MDQVATRLLWICFRPSTAIVLLGAAGLLLLWCGRGRFGRWFTAASLGTLAACLVLPVHQWLLLPLEQRFPPAGALGRVDGIIVLGGAVDPYLTEQHGIPALNDAAERMTAFVALARQHPEAQLAFAGGNGSVVAGSVTEADVAGLLFSELGLTRAVTFDPNSRNTYENAVFLRAAVRPQPGQAWMLVTSASHMPRSVGSFRQAGWPVTAWPVGFKVGRRASLDFDQGLPSRLGSLDVAVHEWLGLVAYFLGGRTDALFPGPEQP